MSRTRRFLGGVGVGYAHQVLVTAVGVFLTPFLLSRMAERSGGATLLANIALLENNARVAAEIALAIAHER